MQIFKSRSPERDKENDGIRYAKIICDLEQVSLNIKAESDGLLKRYRNYQFQAQSIIASLDAEGKVKKLEENLKIYEKGMMYCESRQAALNRMGELFHDTAVKFKREVELLETLLADPSAALKSSR